MNELHDRLDELGRTGTEGVRVTRPDVGGGRRARRKVWLPIGALAAVVAVVVGIIAWQAGGRDGGDEVVTTDHSTTPDAATATSTPPPATATSRTPTVAIVAGVGGEVGEPSTLRIRFVAPDGSLIADRAWREVQEPAPGLSDGRVYTVRGLLQRVPVGRTRIEIADPADPSADCVTSVDATVGAQLIVRRTSDGSAEGRDGCTDVTTLEDWIGRPGVGGKAAAQSYLGLTVTEAEAMAKDRSMTTRVVGDNGLDNAVTMDLRSNRVNLTVWDDHVVAASIG